MTEPRPAPSTDGTSDFFFFLILIGGFFLGFFGTAYYKSTLPDDSDNISNDTGGDNDKTHDYY